jgi:hypothetical protein
MCTFIISVQNNLHVDRDEGVSMRHLGEELNVSHMTIWRILNEHLLYPYHL